MNMRKALLIVILITSLTNSVLIVTVYGTTNDTEPVIFFNLKYEPTQVIQGKEVNVICSVEGVYIHSFTDDFEREELGLNWTGMIGTWTIEGGHLMQSEVEDFQRIFAGNSSWSNYMLKLKVKKIGTNDNTLQIIFRKGNDDTLTDLYLVSLRADESKVGIYRGSGDTFQSSDWIELGKIQRASDEADKWYNVKIEVSNNTLKTKIWAEEGENEPTEWFARADSDYDAGKIGLSCSNKAAFDDIEVYTQTTGIKEVNLWYSVNNGTLKKILMADDDGNYQATIPNQAAETSVNIYVEAVDDLGNKFNSHSISYIVRARAIPWFTIGIVVSAVSIIALVWFAFRKGYLAIEIIE